jgi:putative ABC transport system ATP-binding protein
VTRGPDGCPIVEARSLGRRFADGAEGIDALVDVSFTVDRGSFVAVEGPSGSGKSTLLHLLAGLDTPTSGEVFVAGSSIGSLSDDERSLLRRNTIGMVLARVELLANLSVWENVALPALLAGARLANVKGRAVELLERVGLGSRADHAVPRLSAGEGQRVAVARALFSEPKLLLADEPTASLDSVRSDDLLALLRSLADDGQTIVMATHDARAASYTHTSLWLFDGRVVPDHDAE